jgi:hypothetical protein
MAHILKLRIYHFWPNYFSKLRGVISVSLENASFHMIYTINWLKKCSISGGRIMAQLFILSHSDAVSFRDIRGHKGTIPSIVTFYLCACRID